MEAKILVVDDNPKDRQLLVTLLRVGGHLVLEAANGAEALEVALSERPDLVITDILMPRMDGYELARELRSNPNTAGIPLIFHAASLFERSARELAQAYGVADVLMKTVEPASLLRAVSGALARSSKADSRASPPEEAERQRQRLVNEDLAASVRTLESVNARLSALVAMSHYMATETDPERLVREACDGARELLDALHAAAGIFGERDGEIHLFTESGDLQPGDGGAWKPKVDGAAMETLLSHEGTMRAQGEAAREAANRLLSPDAQVTAFLAVRIESPSQRYGWLCFGDKLEGEAFTRDDERIAAALGKQLAVAYENLMRYRLIHEAEEQYRTLVEDSPDAISVFFDEIIAYVNPAAVALYGAKSREELLGRPVFDIVPPEQRQGARERMLEFQEGRGPLRVEHQQILTLDGRIVDFEATVVGITYQGKRATQAITRDVSAREKVEGALRQELAFREYLMTALPGGLYTCDVEGRITWFNRTAAEIWGREPALNSPADLYSGALKLEWPNGVPLPHEESAAAESLRLGIEVRDSEVVVVRPDGSRRIVLVNLAPMKDVKGNVTGIVNCFVDVTDRRRTEQELLRTRQVSRTVVRQLLEDLGSVGGIGRMSSYHSGEKLAEQLTGETLQEYLEGFASMGLGQLAVESEDTGAGKWFITGEGLMAKPKQHTPEPTCHQTAGFIAGALRRVRATDRILVAEITCKSSGDPACRFAAQQLDAV